MDNMNVKMQKGSGWGMLILVVLLWTSCMGEGGHLVRYSSRRAVVQESPWKSLYVTDDSIPEGYLISSSDLEGREELKAGDCCVVEYRVDFAEQYKDGVYAAEILRCDLLPKWYLSPQMTDTAAILVNEQFSTPIFTKGQYMKGRYFLDVQFKQHQDSRQDLVELSYNPKEVLQIGENGQRVYNLYLRAWKEGIDDSTKVNSKVVPTAFVIEDFMEETGRKEMELGNETLNFVINYPQRFNTDTTACIWAASDTVSIRLD